MIGQTLNNRYEIRARLGKGAMGTVYRATDTQSGQDVALKIISSDLVVDSDLLERFKREGEALRQLKHPNIVSFIDAFHHDEQYVIVMEYVSGGSLHDLIKAGPLPIEQTRQIALDLCDALIRAHRLNIIHRDLKPENILIDQDGTPKLADFGVARLNEGTRMTRSGTQVGTPYYMAPEAWEGKTLDAQADIWSLGVILFEMLTGQVPFGGETGAAVMNKVLTTQLPDLKKLRADVPPSLAQIIKKMLARHKNQRYPTMRQLAADLERGQLVGTSTIPKTKSSSRLPVLIGLGLILAMAAVWRLNQYQDVPSSTQISGPTNTPRSTTTSGPTITPTVSNTSTPSADPLIANLGSVVFNESFDDMDFPFTVPGLGRIEAGALVLEGTGNGLYASFLVEPDITTVILFKTTSGTQFNIGYHTGGYGTETLRRFSYESSTSRWELYEGNVDASGGNIPIRRWQASPLQFDTWHYFLLTRSANGDIDAKIFERDNPQNMIELRENLGSEWGQLSLSSFIDFRLGSVLVDEYQDIQPSGEFANQTTPTESVSIPPTAILNEPDRIFYDQFEDSAHDGRFDGSLWVAQSSNCTITQLGGILRFVNEELGSHQECDLFAGRPTTLQPARQLGIFEIHAMISSDYNRKSVVTKEIQFRTDALSEGTWFAICGLIARDSSEAKGFMSIALFGSTPSDTEYYQEISLEQGFDAWHIVRLEMDPESLAISCLIDGQLIGAVIPKNAELLATVQLARAIEAARGSGAFATSYVDNVYFEAPTVVP